MPGLATYPPEVNYNSQINKTQKMAICSERPHWEEGQRSVTPLQYVCLQGPEQIEV